MKARFSEKYWYDKWEQMLIPVPDENYINLEQMLEDEIKVFKNIEISKDQMELIKQMYAKHIAVKATALVHRELKILKDIDSGKAQWGFTNRTQDINYDYNYRQRFEFNCIQLRDFKRKYKIAE